MDKHHAMAGVGGTIRIGAIDFRLRPLTLGDLAELKAHVVARREPARNARPRSRAHRSAATCRADSRCLGAARIGRGATAEEIDDYLQSFRGTAHLFWLMAREDCPALDSLAAARSCLAEYAEGRLLELHGRLDQATGFLSDTANLANAPSAGTAGFHWARLYRHLSLTYGWTPAEINRLTPFQATMYANPQLSENGTIRMKLSDAVGAGARRAPRRPRGEPSDAGNIGRGSTGARFR